MSSFKYSTHTHMIIQCVCNLGGSLNRGKYEIEKAHYD